METLTFKLKVKKNSCLTLGDVGAILTGFVHVCFIQTILHKLFEYVHFMQTVLPPEYNVEDFFLALYPVPKNHQVCHTPTLLYSHLFQIENMISLISNDVRNTSNKIWLILNRNKA